MELMQNDIRLCLSSLSVKCTRPFSISPSLLNSSHANILRKESCEITLESGGLMVHPVNANIGMTSST